MQVNPIDFHASHGPMSDPGKHAALFSDLPDDVPALCKVVQGLLIHEGWVRMYGVTVPQDRALESGLRTVSEKLDHIRQLDERPLDSPRPAQQRLFGVCRDFALLLTAMLQQKGIPARLRFGFATYFNPPELKGYGEHVVTEYWHARERRWALADAQLDELQCKAARIAFDPCDVPRDVYLSADVAWQRCRDGEADPKEFGFLPGYTGLWYVKSHLARDIAALNKVEMLCWDYWGIFERRDADWPAEDLALLDQAARLSRAGEEAFGELRSLYLRDMRLRVAPVVKAWYVEDEEKYRLEEIFGRELSLVRYL